MAVTGTTQLSPAVKEYYDRLILMTAHPALNFSKFAQKRSLPEKSGNMMVFRRYGRLDTATIPLSGDGVVPPGASLNATDIKAEIKWYGNFVTITDQVEYTVQDRVMNEASRLLAKNMAETIDEITRDVLVGAATVINCSGGENGNTPTELTDSDIKAVVSTLLGNDAEMISEVVVGEDRFNTAPVRPAFFGFIHTDLIDDLERVSTFISSANYPNNQAVMDNEWGATGNVRWLYSSAAAKSSASTPVYAMPIVGKEAYGAIDFNGRDGEMIVNPMGSAGSADPLKQKGSVSYKVGYAARILQDCAIANLQATHS